MSLSIRESSFCKNCENFMDITNNISGLDTMGSNPENIISESEDNIQEGGNQNNLLGVQIESSDYDVSLTESIGGSSISDNNVKNILNGDDVDLELKNFNIKDLNKIPLFNKLSNNQKTLVINRILEKIPKQKNAKSTENITKESYFYCKSCGYNEKIPEKQFVFSRGDEKNDNIYNYKFTNYKHDNILPRTKNYNCINDKCSTHKNPAIKYAVFYRNKDSYNTRYICTVCDKFWDTFVEK